MDCERAQQFFHAYIDGELPFERARDIQDHLRDCDACLDRVIDLYSVGEKLDEQRVPSVSDDFTKDVMAEARSRQESQTLWEFGRRVGLAATLCVGIALGSFMAVDVNRYRSSSMESEATSVASATVDQPSTSNNQQVAYQSNVLSESDEGSLANRYFQAESQSATATGSSP